MNESDSVKNEVMNRISKGGVHMRPKWHFLCFSSFALAGIALLFFTLFYVVSLLIFVMRANGAWFMPSFGFHDWFVFFHAMPWLLLALLALFIFLLQTLVRRYEFVYRKPLLYTTLSIIFVISIGGYFLARTSLHQMLIQYTKEGWAHSGMYIIYGGPLDYFGVKYEERVCCSSE